MSRGQILRKFSLSCIFIVLVFAFAACGGDSGDPNVSSNGANSNGANSNGANSSGLSDGGSNPSSGAPNYTYTVTFDKNGGDTEASPATKTVVDPATTVGTLPTPPTQTGCTFEGWATAPDGGTEFTANTPVTADITVYAQWGNELTTTNHTLVWIKPGTFQMGSPSTEANRNSFYEAQHQVTLTRGFYMGKYQVTQELYQRVTGSNTSRFTNSPAEGEVQEKRPVERVNWYHTIVFCNKLSMLEGLTPVYTISGSTDPADWGTVPTGSVNTTWNAVTMNGAANGYRLPTEAEWEYACRAGTTTAYNTGNTMSDNTGWYNGNSGNTTHEVGKKPPNAWGLYDMHGNVWEWCWDWAAVYDTTSENIDPEGPTGTAGFRIRRGGSYDESGATQRSAARKVDTYVYDAQVWIGFRVARRAS